MTPEDVKVILGDSLDELKKLPDESVHLIVTSPPYWALRDYKVPPTTWPDGWIGGLGLEPTPEKYIEHLTDVMTECQRVLRRDGTLWLNLGDSYATGGGSVGTSPGGGAQGERWARGETGEDGIGPMTQPNRMAIDGLQSGDLVGIPWRVAIAMQADGWRLRRDNIWFKPIRCRRA